MRYRDPTRETAGDARRDLLDAAVVLGAHVYAPEGDVDDEIIVRALPAFMDARERYLASLGARYGITLDSGPRPTHAHHSVLDVARRFGLTAWHGPAPTGPPLACAPPTRYHRRVRHHAQVAADRAIAQPHGSGAGSAYR
jgi:hypothetical protein